MAKQHRGGKRYSQGWTYNGSSVNQYGGRVYTYQDANGSLHNSSQPPSRVIGQNWQRTANPTNPQNSNAYLTYLGTRTGGAGQKLYVYGTSTGGTFTSAKSPSQFGPNAIANYATVMQVTQQQTQTQPQPQQQTQQAQSTPTQIPTPQQVSQGNIMPKGGVPFKQFEQMTDDQKANVVSQALQQGVPAFLDQSDMQRFAYFTGMSDKPQIVTESQLNNMRGYSLWRSVHDSYNRSTDIGYTKEDIADQLMRGDYTNYSDSGGSAYGKALYFDVQKGSYGSGSGYAIMHAKLNPNARIISDSRADTMYSQAVRNGDKLALACSKADGNSARNLYCLAKGYDVIQEGYGRNGGYHMVLNRRALIMSSQLH